MTSSQRPPRAPGLVLERREDHFYDELTRTNNELADLHRAMAVANAELREAQRALGISEQRYRNLSACAPVGVLELTTAGACRYANAAWRVITGLAETESLGDGWQRALDRADAADVIHAWGLDVGAAREVRVVTTTGESRWVDVRSQTLEGAQGEAGGSVCTIQDITARKQAEAELARLGVLLVDASRRAGMAEVAAGVLHKVGTALTSLNVASTCVGEDLRSLKLASLARVVALLEAHEGDLGGYLGHDPQGVQVAGFLVQLSADLAAGHAAALGDLAQLQIHVERIKDIVRAHEALTDRGTRTELALPAEVLARVREAVAVPPTVRIIEELAPVPAISVDVHRLERVLGELLRTALGACQEEEGESPQITLRLESSDEWIRIRVSHTGRGIAVDELPRVFMQGHGGGGGVFELHDAAISATEMGGSLRVHSEGLEHGAAYTLELPAGRGEAR